MPSMAVPLVPTMTLLALHPGPLIACCGQWHTVRRVPVEVSCCGRLYLVKRARERVVSSPQGWWDVRTTELYPCES
jgi:hypothetical protein